MIQFCKTIEAVLANNSGTMEADTISKTGGTRKATRVEEKLQEIAFLHQSVK